MSKKILFILLFCFMIPFFVSCRMPKDIVCIEVEFNDSNSIVLDALESKNYHEYESVSATIHNKEYISKIIEVDNIDYIYILSSNSIRIYPKNVSNRKKLDMVKELNNISYIDSITILNGYDSITTLL